MSLDLSGSWRAAIADDELRRTGIGLDTDDDGWEHVAVPGHWRSVPAFAASDGPLLYRKRFELDPPPRGERRWVVLDGVFYQGDLWLDGAYLGDPEGYFFPHAYEITDLARLGREHVLAVEVTCWPQRDKRAKRNLSGVFQDGTAIDPAWNPGGLWRPVRITSTGPVRIDALRVLSRDVNEARANVVVRAALDSDAARTVRITTSWEGRVVTRQERALARGMNEVGWNVDLEQPPIWWPWSLGDQPLTEIAVTVEADGVTSDERVVTTGLREVAMDGWRFAVNGERLFVKGALLGPSRRELGEMTGTELRRDVELAREAGLDLLRITGHISRPELYRAADELGMLVWQDFPLHGGYARSVRRQAVRQVAKAVDLLGHHPSIALWCGHDEPFTAEHDPDGDDRAGRARRLREQQLPTWNRSILDRWVKRAFDKADETRPVIGASGLMPHFPRLDGTDAHLDFGWSRGEVGGLAAYAAALPRQVRFVTGFGAQAAPDTFGWAHPERWPALDWEELGTAHGMDLATFDRRTPPALFDTAEEWIAATQRYQALLLKEQIETLRRLKYHPTGGFCFAGLADAQPSVSANVLDHLRHPKQAYFAVSEACRPVIVVADPLPAALHAGDALGLDVHVVNDLHRELGAATVDAHLTWPGGEHRWRFAGDVPADCCCRVGIVRFVVPAVAGELVLSLTLDAGDVAATNAYRSTISASG